MKNRVWKVFVAELLLIIIFATAYHSKANAKTIVHDGDLRIIAIKDNGDTVIKFSDGRSRRFDFDGRIKLINEKNLTAKKLRSRRNKIIYVEKIVSMAINRNWGVIIRKEKNKTGKYEWIMTKYRICYESCKVRPHKGDVVHTYNIYSPYTTWADDITERYDTIIRR